MRARAARLVAHRSPLVVDEVELPAHEDGDVLVELRYGGVNPLDRYCAEGLVASDVPLPRTIGGEASGTLDGRPVVVHGHGLGIRRDGVWATAARVPPAAITEIPIGLGLEIAAAMGVAGVTAWRVVTEYAEVTDDDRVLVLGASGGVGSMVVSLVRSTGASVWGQTSSPDKVAFVTARGAEHVVVAGADELAAAVGALEPTVVIDALGAGFTGAALSTMAENGRLVIFGTSAGPVGELPLQVLYRRGVTVRGYGGLIATGEELARGMSGAMKAVTEGRLEVVVDEVMPLEAVNEAVGRLARREVSGKLVLDLGR